MKRSGPERGAANRGDLRPLDLATFAARLARALSGSPPHPAVVARLHAHHAELVLWSARIDLVGPAAEGDLFERHYAESLAALPLLVESDRRLVDLGSGAGFPGFVLAAARPDLEVLLVEPRQKRRAFLAAATRRASLSCRCLDARVSANAPPELPGGIDIVTLRALRLERQALERLLPLLSRRGRILVWSGREGLELPGGLRAGSVLPLAGATHRAIRVYERSDDR